MWMLSKWGQNGCTGFATRPWSSVSASSKWLNSSVTTGTGTGINGKSATRKRHKSESQHDRREGRPAHLHHRSSRWPPPALPRQREPRNDNYFQKIEVLADALPHSAQREKQDLYQLHICFIGPFRSTP